MDPHGPMCNHQQGHQAKNKLRTQVMQEQLKQPGLLYNAFFRLACMTGMSGWRKDFL